MDELQISGKQYLSSRRVAKDNGYHTDYIGQLIRAGKIKGQKVGRAWYVEEDSFLNYLGSETAPTVSLSAVPAIQTEAQEELVEESVPVEQIAAAPIVVRVEVASAPAAEPEPVAIGPQTKLEPDVTPIAVRKVTPAPAPEEVIYHSNSALKQGGLRYVAHDEPLLPEIPKKINATVMPSAPLADESIEKPLVARRGERRRASRLGLTFVALTGVVVFVAAAILGSSMFEVVSVHSDGTASATYSLNW